jgi:membrane protease YdiL (CAAX protease family)
MNDPTHHVLTFGLVLTLVCFTTGCLLRWNNQTTWDIRPRPPADGPEPCPPPVDCSGFPMPSPLPPSGRVPVWFYHPLDLLGAAFILLVFCGAMLFPAKQPDVDLASLEADVMLLNIGFQFVMAAIILCLVFWRVNIVTWLGLRWRDWHWALLIAPATVFLMWMLFVMLHLSGYIKWMDSMGVETVQETVQLLRESNDPLILGLMTFAAVIAAPLCEEIVFRGYLYPVMKRFAGPWTAGIGSAFIFAAAHGNLTALLPLFILGGLLVLLYEKTGSIWAPISVHFCFNGATVVIQFAARILDIPIDSNL